MPSFRFYPRSPKAESSSIQLRIRSGSQGTNSIKVGTGIVIKNPAKSWDSKKDRVHRAYSIAQPINKRLTEIKAEAERLYYHAETSHVDDPIRYVKEQLEQSSLVGSVKPPADSPSTTVAPVTLLEVFDLFCDAKRDEYAESTLKSYATTRMHLSVFETKNGVPSLANGVDVEWVDAFRKYLRKRGLSDNSLRRSLKILKTCLKWADERGHVTDTSYIRAIKLGNEKESLAIALTKEQLELIERADLSERPGLDRIRWWFVAQCCTGVRFADLHKVTSSNVKSGFLPLQPMKTKDQTVKLPVSPLLQRAFDHLEDQPLDFSAQHYNRKLKELGRLLEFDDTTTRTIFKGGKRVENTLPMHDLLTSHTARRTFITILLRAGHPHELVMKLSGHQDVRSFRKYVKMTEEDTVDAVNSVFV